MKLFYKRQYEFIRLRNKLDKISLSRQNHISFWRFFYGLRIILVVLYIKEASFVYQGKRGFLFSDALDCGIINLKVENCLQQVI